MNYLGTDQLKQAFAQREAYVNWHYAEMKKSSTEEIYEGTTCESNTAHVAIPIMDFINLYESKVSYKAMGDYILVVIQAPQYQEEIKFLHEVVLEGGVYKINDVIDTNSYDEDLIPSFQKNVMSHCQIGIL